MTDAKPWYLSRTIWASLVTVVTALAGLAGVSLEGLDDQLFVDSLLQAVTALSGLIAILGRISASKTIG